MFIIVGSVNKISCFSNVTQGTNGATRDETLLQLTVPTMFVQVRHKLAVPLFSQLLHMNNFFCYLCREAKMVCVHWTDLKLLAKR